jgi:MFS family permease
MSTRDAISLLLMILLSFFLMADMFITPAIVLELAEEYGVATGTIGIAGSAFMLLGALTGLYFGYANDRFSRKRLLIFTVLLGETACLLTGVAAFTNDFSSFVLMRLLTGIGVGGIYPITFSLLSDYVSEKHRAKACAGVDIAWGLGMLSGPLLAGIALQTDYGWRLAYILAAVPSFPLLALYARIAREPERGASEAGHQQGVDQAAFGLSDLKLVLSNRTNILLFLQGIPGSVPWGVLPFWLITFFREARGFETAEATSIWELFGIATVVGGLLWAILGDWLFNKRPAYTAMLCTLVIALGMTPIYLLLNIEWPSLSHYLVLVVTGGMLISVASANVRALLMNVNTPNHRGSVFAVYNFADNIGKGIGPALGGLILATASDYQLMVNLAVSCWLLCVVFFAGVIFTVEKDRQQMLTSLRRQEEGALA